MDERTARQRLTAERSATARRLAEMDDELAGIVTAAAGSNVDDEHDPEGATIAFEREQFAASRTHAQELLRELDAALERLDQHRYGRCESCGRDIGDARLEALPPARLCIVCAAQRHG